LASVDKAVYGAVAEPMPTLDEPLRRLSNLANNSKPGRWPRALYVFGGRRGGAPLTGAIAIGVNSAVVNLPVKYAARRARPDRAAAGAGRALGRDAHVDVVPVGALRIGIAFAAAVGGSPASASAAGLRPPPTRVCTPASTTPGT
jgi:undecaprenyl-diphosphatase